MLLIFEGVDGSGKSTLAKALQEYWGFKIVNFKYPQYGISSDEQIIEQLKEYNTVLKLFELFEDKDIIFDRFHLGELVYPQVIRQYNVYNKTRFIKEFKWIDTFLSEMKVKLVYCYAPLQVLIERLQEKKDAFILAEHLQKLLDNYQKALLWTQLETIKIDTSKMNKQEMFDFARKQLNLIRKPGIDYFYGFKTNVNE